MSDSSGDLVEILSKVDTKQICHLLSILSLAQIRKPEFIERTYLEQARHFAETLQFLTDISWIAQRDRELSMTESGLSACRLVGDDAAIRDAILTALIGNPSPYRHPVAQYIRCFKVDGPYLRHRPSLSERTREKPLRDFLMDLRSVSYSLLDEAYVLEDSVAPLYLWATNLVRPRSHKTFEEMQRRREELGFAAELAVLDYEKARVGGNLAAQVEHVSADQPFSCYDIKSLTVMAGQTVERYIEVKAVPVGSLQFYWSRSEIDAAQILRDRYFLYLLPYALGRGFDIEALLIVADPYRTLYGDHNNWEIEENVLVCRKRPAAN